MQLTVNGTDHEVGHPQTVTSLIDVLGMTRRDVAVALDGRVVPRTGWDGTEVGDGAVVEIVTAVQGG